MNFIITFMIFAVLGANAWIVIYYNTRPVLVPIAQPTMGPPCCHDDPTWKIDGKFLCIWCEKFADEMLLLEARFRALEPRQLTLAEVYHSTTLDPEAQKAFVLMAGAGGNCNAGNGGSCNISIGGVGGTGIIMGGNWRDAAEGIAGTSGTLVVGRKW